MEMQSASWQIDRRLHFMIKRRLHALLALIACIGGCAVAPAPLNNTPGVVATPQSGQLNVTLAPATPIGNVQPVYVSIANGTDMPRSVVPSQVFALNEDGNRVAPLPPGEAARQAGGANELKGAMESAALGGILEGAIGAGVGAIVGSVVPRGTDFFGVHGAANGAAVGGAMALVVGALALRLRGPYFAVFTFGLAELAKHTLIWYETRVTGTVGRLLLSPPGPWTLYYTVLALAGLAVATALLLRRSRWGYALVGIGEDEERALTLGIDTTRVKVGTFALSAAFMGAVGAAMAPRWTYLDPQVFNPLVPFQTVIMALVGGATTVVGPALGAAFLGLVSELFLLRFRYVYMLALGLTLIAVVVAFPSGLAGIGRRAPRERQG